MATLATVATVISAGAAVIGAVQQRKAARQTRRAQERAAAVSNRQANLRRQRGIRQQLARARVLRAQTIASGFAAGAPGASVVRGAAGGVQTDAAANVGFSNQIFGLEQQRVGFLNQAAAAQSRGAEQAALFGGISQVSGLFTNPTANAGLFN